MSKIKIEITCTQCGRECNKPISKIDSVEDLVCPSCGGKLTINTVKLRAATQRNVDAAEKLVRQMADLKKLHRP